MIYRANINSMPGYGYERDLGLGCTLLRGSKQNCDRQCKLFQHKKIYGCQCKLLQGKNLMWALSLNLKGKKKP